MMRLPRAVLLLVNRPETPLLYAGAPVDSARHEVECRRTVSTLCSLSLCKPGREKRSAERRLIALKTISLSTGV
jgi:hypothetical protein